MAERPVLTVGQVFELAGCVECDRLAAAWPLPLPATALVKICGPAHNCGATSLGHAQIVKDWTCCPPSGPAFRFAAVGQSAHAAGRRDRRAMRGSDSGCVPGAQIAHCEVKQMLDRMQYLIGGTGEPCEQDGWFADTQSGDRGPPIRPHRHTPSPPRPCWRP